jgi:hypothetical protein
MVYARMSWVSAESKIPMRLEHSCYGWTLYESTPEDKGRLTEIAYSESLRGMYQILKGMYELLYAMKRKALYIEELKIQ